MGEKSKDCFRKNDRGKKVQGQLREHGILLLTGVGKLQKLRLQKETGIDYISSNVR